MPNISRWLVAATLLVAPGAAQASGFYLQEGSTIELGRAFSGIAAAAEDAATIEYNPAGMTRLKRANFSTNMNFLFLDSRTRDTGSTRSVPGLPTAVPTGGGAGGTPFRQPVLIPSGFAAFQVPGRPVWFGLGIYSPFGLSDRYSPDFFARYDSLKSDVKTVDIAPSLAVKIGDHLSIGGGLNVEFIDVKLRNALPNLSPRQPDGELDASGSDQSLGWNVGATLDMGAVRIGGSYRSRIKHRLTGSLLIQGLLGPLAAGNASAFASTPLTLPDIATVSLVAGRRLRFSATGRWVDWSVFKQILIEPVGGQSQVSPQDYRDAWSGAAGLDYDVSPRLTLRTGGQYETTPIRDEHRSTRVPDGNRIWASAGASYAVTPAVALNLAYAHIFLTDETIARSDPYFQGTAGQITVQTSADTRGNGDEIAAGLTARF